MSQKYVLSKQKEVFISLDSDGKNVWVLGLHNIILNPREAINIAESIIEHARKAYENK